MIHNAMTNPSPIEQTVMSRVRAIHTLRPVISLGTLSVLVLVFALWEIGREVWVARVLENAPHTFIQTPQFYLAAFTHTRFVVQALSLTTLAALLLLAREVARFISRSLTLAWV